MVRATITQGATCCAQDGNFLQELEQSALVRRSLADFRRVTGLAAKLVPAALPTHLIKFGAQDIDFCRALGCSARACQACFRHQTDLLNRLDRKLKPQQNYRSEEHTSELQSLRHLVCR